METTTLHRHHLMDILPLPGVGSDPEIPTHHLPVASRLVRTSSLVHTRRMRRLTAGLATLAAFITIAGCAVGSASTAPEGSSSPPTASARLPDGVLAVVSRSRPSAEALDVLARCHIGDGEPVDLSQVTGMAQLASGSELVHFVPLTGLEPELADLDPVWVVQVEGELQQLGDQVWINPTCIASSTRAGYFATGPVKHTASGKEAQAVQPSVPPDRSVPPLEP